MDPFITMKYNGKSYQTRVIEEGGKDPKWNESFEIPIYQNAKSLDIQCMDDDYFINDSIGESSINIDEWCIE